MAPSDRRFNPHDILYGPPLPPTREQRLAEGRAPDESRPWGEGYFLEVDLGERSYVVVEEVVDENVGVVISPWPRVDPERGLRFGDAEERREAVVDRATLQRRLSEREVVAYDVSADPEMRRRRIAPGDVFAVETAATEGGDLRDRGDSWIEGTVVDVTAMARDAAKAAMLSALTGVPLELGEAEALAETDPEAEAGPPTEPAGAG